MIKRIGIVGLGKLGLPLALAFASRGFKVIGVDINPDVIESIKTKRFFYEPGVTELLLDNDVRRRFSVTDDLEAAILLANVTIVIVATPNEEDGCFSLKYVLPVIQDIGNLLRKKEEYHLVIVSSTVNPGDCENFLIPELIEQSGKEVGFCYVPEFVALGNVLNGFLEPDGVVIGASNIETAATASAIYGKLCKNKPSIKQTDLVNAELVKIAANCHTVLKTAFGNQMAELCEAIPRADVDEVTEGIALDSRASPEYLRGSTMAAGPCLLPSELIQTERGLCRIDAIVKGDKVWGHDGQLHAVIKIHERNYEGSMVNIVPEGFGGHPLIVTPDHPIWAAARRHAGGKRFRMIRTTGKVRLSSATGYSDMGFLPAATLGVGDLMGLPQIRPNPIPVPGMEMQLSPWSQVRAIKAITPELMRLFGFYISEGSLWKRGEIKFSFHKREKDFAEDISQIIRKYFDAKTRIKKSSANGIHTRTTCKPLAGYLRTMFGHRAENKCVPNEWLGLPNEFLVELMRGIWYGDGSKSCDVFTWATVSRKLYNFMKLLMLKLGVAFTTVLYAPKMGKDGVFRQAAYFLKVHNPMYFDKMNALLPKLAIRSERSGKKSVWFRNNNMVYHIRRVECLHYGGKVYNLEVEEVNSYMTESAVVHNCFLRDLRSLSCIAERYGVRLPLIETTEKVNYWQVERLTQIIRNYCFRRRTKKIGILGLTYKPGVNVHEPSAGLLLLEKLEHIMTIVAYDPAICVGQSVGTPEELIEMADIIVVTTPWKVFKKIEFRHGQVVIDCWRFLNQEEIEGAGAEYVAIGRG